MGKSGLDSSWRPINLYHFSNFEKQFFDKRTKVLCLSYQIKKNTVADPTREVARKLGMLDTNYLDKNGLQFTLLCLHENFAPFVC